MVLLLLLGPSNLGGGWSPDERGGSERPEDPARGRHVSAPPPMSRKPSAALVMACHCLAIRGLGNFRRMSKSRTTQKKKSQKTPQGKPGHVAELDAFDALQIDVLLPQLSPLRAAPITDAHRAAYGSLISDVQADALGGRTQAIDIRTQAMRWAPIIDTAIRTHADVLQGYTSERFVHSWSGSRCSTSRSGRRAEAQQGGRGETPPSRRGPRRRARATLVTERSAATPGSGRRSERRSLPRSGRARRTTACSSR